MSAGSPIGVPPGSAEPRVERRAGTPHTAARPSRPHPAHAAGKARSSAAVGEPAERRHRADDGRPAASPGLSAAPRRGSSAIEVTDGRPAPLDRADRQLQHAVRAPHERHQPGPGAQARVDGRRTGRAPSRAGSGLAEEDGVDRRSA